MVADSERLKKLHLSLGQCGEELLALGHEGEPLRGIRKAFFRLAGVVESVRSEIGHIIHGTYEAGGPAKSDAAQAYLRVLHRDPIRFGDLDMDAFADGIVAHRAGLGFHKNPHGADALTVSRLSWSMGWNERALARR